jgi:hypothetical protein
LALLLSALWVGAAPPHTSTRATSWWADLIGLPEPATRGTRTVSSNLHELHSRGFITLTPSTDGRPNRIDLLNETGSRQQYQQPYRTGEHYKRIPETLWTTGKIGELDGRALAMYLILLYYHRDPDTWTWFSSESFRQRHSLSDNLRTKGLNLLVQTGVAQRKEAYVDADLDGEYRTTRRRWYQLMPTYQPPKSPGKPVPKRVGDATDDILNPAVTRRGRTARFNAGADDDPWGSTPRESAF